MKNQIVSKRMQEAGLGTKPAATHMKPVETYEPRYRRPDYSKVAGVKDATLHDPISDIGRPAARTVVERPRKDYVPPLSSEAPHIITKAQLAKIVDDCVKAVSVVLDGHKLVWNALGWLDIRKNLERIVAEVVEKKAKAYPNGFHDFPKDLKVVEGEGAKSADTTAVIGSLIALHTWMRDNTGPSDGTLDMLKRSHDALVAAGVNPLEPDEDGGIGDHDDHEALPPRSQTATDEGAAPSTTAGQADG